ncbi:MAG: hypothetical protein AAF993_10770 [Pseudomonadota bacterium]
MSEPSQGSDPVEAVKDSLKPKFMVLIEYLNEQHEILAASFFTELLVNLTQAEEEEELLTVFFQLSSTAFMGFQFDPISWQLADEILQEAEQVAHTFSGSTQQMH